MGQASPIYLRDPDDNGVELYCDMPKDRWPRDPQGNLAMYTRALDLRALQTRPFRRGPEDL